ncbi:hypothetical protein [Nitrolancea hollandica]|uniref:Putative membrane protein n=1 Tax=Nitrolancea hollandica Lb TaxID=1129897 RepID=I4EDA7_9BACT|nr:hypothetical protein [Nitrolancea hollandica]CCF82669.1 putative membrane protein [Nitrolancea hollandica Lb]
MSVRHRGQERGSLWAWLLNGLRLARAEIRLGRYQRGMAIMAAFAAIVSGFEAYTQHLRGAFSHWLMWTPVALTPVVTAAAAAAVFSRRAARRVLPLVSLITLLDGVIGFIFHIRGIQRMPGGIKLGQYNIVMGPPVFAPLLMCTVGALGGVASLLRREKWDLTNERGSVRPLRRRRVADGAESPMARLTFDIAHGRFQQGFALLSVFFALLSGGEAYFEHLRGSFNQRVMWAPVWVTPVMMLAGIGAACSRRIARVVLPVTSAVTFLVGTLGFVLHLRGLWRMPGRLGNFEFKVMLGPPLFAPLLFCAVGLLGLVAALLRREGD